ncbi:MAG: alanine--tRNA ligase, partial [Thermoproteota archaeon]
MLLRGCCMSLSWVGSAKTRLLYYEDPYLKEFKSRVVASHAEGGKLYVVLEETCFHPEGGGQPGDTGVLEWSGGTLRVVDTQPAGSAVVHVCEGRQLPKVGELVSGRIDWGRRYQLMKSHTASHIVFSAARRVLGVERLVYMGFQIALEKTRIDLSYGRPIAREQLERIEQLANTVAMEGRRVRWWTMSREEAERRYGSKLGVTEVTPAGEVRVVEVEGWDVSLCSGTHVKLTSEVAPIRILGRMRLQKGVERLEFAAGEPAYRAMAQQLKLAEQAAKAMGVSLDKLPAAAEAAARERSRLKKELAKLGGQLAEYVA